ncbi:DUF805 domain-containing protein [Enterobacter hormaechei]|nr:DUF805 domain-containing protein [Klebsiella variicola]EKZ5807387.1 DUF805 domain-containing protein [Klebsiella variicola]ELD3473846.1 DUF805 domain-containing protein [Enterobacter hormaechei]ELD3487889.1 DUF805 domain-containing protein [Enterobacter hormaechei]HCT5211548.1 DUF805 domain-containing protein [Enterobacter hormaechei]
MSNFILVLKKTFVYNGRSKRSEYWKFILAEILIYCALVLSVVFIGEVANTICYILSFLLFFPYIAVLIRRLHDTDRSGWWLLLYLVPLLGPFVLLYFTCQGSSEGNNCYGPNPN